MRQLLVVALLLALGAKAQAADAWQQAQFNYQMFCQGCHTPDGSGATSVPRMKDHVGKFLTTQRGREYLVRVPGSALSALDDEGLAEVLNWIVDEFSGVSAPADKQDYTAEEVGALRQKPLNEVVDYRLQLLAEIAAEESNSGSVSESN